MTPKVSIIIGSSSDLGMIEATTKVFDEFEIPFEINALSAHRTLGVVEKFARSAKYWGIKVIIAATVLAAHLPGVVTAMAPLQLIGVPVNRVSIASIPWFPSNRCLPGYLWQTSR